MFELLQREKWWKDFVVSHSKIFTVKSIDPLRKSKQNTPDFLKCKKKIVICSPPPASTPIGVFLFLFFFFIVLRSRHLSLYFGTTYFTQ